MEPESQNYKDHQIEIRPRDDRDREGILLLDGTSLAYGRLDDGQYYLKDYAYEWSDDLVDLARRYVNYLERAEEARTNQEARAK